MFIQWVQVENYRNLENVEIFFHDTYNYLVGENAIGKSNFLDLWQTLLTGRGFAEADFLKPERPIRVRLRLVPEQAQCDFLRQCTQAPVAETSTLMIEQLVQEVFPRAYRIDEGMEEIPLGFLRSTLNVYHRHTGLAEMRKIPATVYQGLEKAISEAIPKIQQTVTETTGVYYSFLQEGTGEDLYQMRVIRKVLRVLDSLSGQINETRPARYTPDNIKLVLQVALKLLAHIFIKYKSVAAPLSASIVYGPKGEKYLSVFISIDEPEIHANPYLQRAIITYYKELLTNQSESFLYLLKKLFDLDGLTGQMLVVTHSTGALVDDYRNIIRFYRDDEGHVQTACGATFNFSQEVAKHLIMHFPEAKEALYARCVIIVEGETEYGSFRGFGRSLGINFDYYGICLINARGEASIGKLAKLFKRFAIPTVVLYDKDVEGKYGREDPNVLFTDEICFEMDFVTHLLQSGQRHILHEIVRELVEDGRGTVTRDMLRKGASKLGKQRNDYAPRRLQHISDRRYDDLVLYYFSWFYSAKGVIVGRILGDKLTADMIPPSFVRVIRRAAQLVW